MKRILILPIKLEGVVDVRNEEYTILDNVKYLEDIQKHLISSRKSINNYKYCQFEGKELIPFFIKIKDKLGNGMQEFEVEKVKFKEIVGKKEYKEELIKERHILPVKQKIQGIMEKANRMIIDEKMGLKIKEDDFLELGIEKEKLEKEINDFNYKDFLNEIV